MGLVHSILNALFPPQAEPIAELVEGRNSIVRGKVIARDLLESPITGDTCVYYNYTIEEFRQSRIAGLPDGFWRVTQHDEAIAEFYLHDEGGRAIIAPQDVRVDRAKGVEPSYIDLGMQWRRATQLLIRPGDIIEVTAVGERVDDLYDDARDYRAGARTLMLRAPDDGQLVIRVLPRPEPARSRISESTATAP